MPKYAVSGYGHRDAPRDAAWLRDRGGLLGDRDSAYRERHVAILPADEVTPIHPPE
jgi:hypothetical protein